MLKKKQEKNETQDEELNENNITLNTLHVTSVKYREKSAF